MNLITADFVGITVIDIHHTGEIVVLCLKKDHKCSNIFIKLERFTIKEML